MLRSEETEHSLASLRVPGTVFRVGRNEGCDLRLEHQTFPLLVSRNHAELVIENGRCILRNLYPLNGTYVSGRKLEGGEAVPVSEGDVIAFGGSKVVQFRDGQAQQCDNPHTFVIDGLEELLSASQPSSRADSTQRLTNPQAETLSQPSSAGEQQQQPAAELAAGEVADAPPPPPPEDPEAAQAPALHLESISLQEQEQQPGTAAQTASSHGSFAAGIPASLPAPDEGTLERITVGLRLPQPDTARVERPAALLDLSIIDLTELDDEEHIQPPLPPVAAPSGSVMQQWAQGQRRKRHRPVQTTEEPVTLDDDEEIEILHDSPAAAEDSAPQIPPDTISDAPAYNSALAKQGDWVKELEDEMSCAVCQDTIVAAHSLVPCGHCFCGTCLFQWLNRKQICPTCRQPTEAPPVRSMVIDNIAAKSESGMKPEEVRDREQRKQTWQALSETALNGWKAMFAKPKRQRAEPAPYPAYMYGGLMANDGHMPGAARSQILEEIRRLAPSTRSASRVHRARQAQISMDYIAAAAQRNLPAARRPREHAMVPPPPPYPAPVQYPAPAQYAAPAQYPAPAQHAAPAQYPAPAQYAAPAQYPPPPRTVRGAASREASVLQPGDVLDVRVVHRPAAAPQLPQDSSGMVHVEYPSPSALPNHCVACRRGWQMGAPRLVSGTHNPVAWHLDCYQLWPAMASRMTSMPGLSRLSPAHQEDIRRRLRYQASRNAVRL